MPVRQPPCMETSDAGRARNWHDVDRDALSRLFGDGLTPDDVGRLYGRSGSLVRLTARRWGLDARALRASCLGLVRTDPQVAAEFVAVVDGAPPHYRPHDLMAGSGARCRCRCSACCAEWVTSVANRTERRSGCPDCARRRHVEVARARPARSGPLSEISAELTRDFVRNIDRPDRDASSTPGGSHDRVLWRCRQKHEWETSARQRVKHGSQCPTCLAGLWTSASTCWSRAPTCSPTWTRHAGTLPPKRWGETLASWTDSPVHATSGCGRAPSGCCPRGGRRRSSRSFSRTTTRPIRGRGRRRCCERCSASSPGRASRSPRPPLGRQLGAGRTCGGGDSVRACGREVSCHSTRRSRRSS
jgi:hypothetical protein